MSARLATLMGRYSQFLGGYWANTLRASRRKAPPRVLAVMVAALVSMPGLAWAGRAPAKTPAAERADWVGEQGHASYYGKAHHGRRTAGGTRFDQNAMTAAHSWLPFGTHIKVTHQASGRSVVVVVTDRLYSTRRIVDLSLGAARALGMLRQGVASVAINPA